MDAFGKTKQWIWLLVLLNLAAFSLCAYLFLEVKRKNEHVSDLVNQIAIQSKQDAAFQRVKSIVGATTDLRKKIGSYFIPKDGVPVFLESVESLGKESGVAVSIKDVDVFPVPDSSLHESLKLSITADGSFESQLQFLSLLEFLPYEVRVGQVSLSAGPSAKKGPRAFEGTIAFEVLKLSQ